MTRILTFKEGFYIKLDINGKFLFKLAFKMLAECMKELNTFSYQTVLNKHSKINKPFYLLTSGVAFLP